jgi:dTDP-4-amino-4,6-dideoxygalactose transaminase
MRAVTKVPFVDLSRQYVDNEKTYVDIFKNIGRSGAYVMGEDVGLLEEEIANYCGVRNCLAVANGTDALILALRAMGIGPGDEVITAPNSFIASAGAIAAVGATMKFVDVRDDLNIDPDKICAAITPKTKAIMPVHLTGRPADMDAVMEIANRNKIYVIDDAAQAFGAEYKGKKVGGLGHITAFSLHPLKNLNVFGDGGLIATNCDGVAEKIAITRNHGLKDRDTCVEWGINSRLDSMLAAIARHKLRSIDQYTIAFRRIAEIYRTELDNIIECPKDNEDTYSVYHNFVVRVPDRPKLQEFLLRNGVETKIHYPMLLHLQPAAKNLCYFEGSFPVAERLGKTMLSLPIFPELRDEELEKVISSIRSYYK